MVQCFLQYFEGGGGGVEQQVKIHVNSTHFGTVLGDKYFGRQIFWEGSSKESWSMLWKKERKTNMHSCLSKHTHPMSTLTCIFLSRHVLITASSSVGF